MEGNALDLLTGAGKSLASALAKTFATNVIERWTKKRAEKFFETFQHEIARARVLGDNPEALGATLDHMMSTELGSEILFDAYRKVCISKSKVIGPRIIGFLSAELCLEGRLANDIEELYFSVAETLSDTELLNVASTIENWVSAAERKDNKDIFNHDGFTFYVLEREESNLSSGESNEVDMVLGNLDEDFGVGIEKLKNLGLLIPSIRQSTIHVSEDSERHIDYDMTVQIVEKKVSFPLKYRRLISLISSMSKGVNGDR